MARRKSSLELKVAFGASANGHSRRRRLTWPRNAASQGTSVNLKPRA